MSQQVSRGKFDEYAERSKREAGEGLPQLVDEAGKAAVWEGKS